ncbi:MAG: phospho-sugar mutase [Defluviitaleaceae bacterium]|nr:phospho-sugar mutase [Defluviitaleaceae bacterium]
MIEKYIKWINHPNLDPDILEELTSIKDDKGQIEQRFHKDLEFGTAGLRGLIGAGTNRINIYTIRKAAYGLAGYILKNTPEGKLPSIAIAYDTRQNSKKFAWEICNIMLACGVKAYIYDDIRSTPQLSFTIRHLDLVAGVMITASHNPFQYNGVKVYWGDGGQISHPMDKEVMGCINALGDAIDLAAPAPCELAPTYLSTELDKAYLQAVAGLSLNPNLNRVNLNVAYTPLHGVALQPVLDILSLGFANVHVVEEQAQPDPLFSTVKYPNPEEPSAFEMAIKLAEDIKADITIATDPDGDRVGVMAKDGSGQYKLLNGNETGVILCEYILSQMSQKGILPLNAAIISTKASTKLTREIAKAYDVHYEETSTGSKNIAKKIGEWKRAKTHCFVYGFEESFGYMMGDFARDKDGIAACMLVCEVAALYKKQGKTLFDALDDIHQKYGYFKEAQLSIPLQGVDNGLAVARDIEAKLKNITLGNGGWFLIRPSGTEPKIKIYMGTKADTRKKATDALEKLRGIIHGKLDL